MVCSLTTQSGNSLVMMLAAIGAGSDQGLNWKKSCQTLALRGGSAIESIYLGERGKTGTRHLKMAIIDNKAKTLRKAEDEEILSEC